MAQSKYIPNDKGINKLINALDESLELTTQFIVKNIHDITPRDLNRPPKDPDTSVTGTLKSSIGYQRVKQLNYKAGSKQGTKNSRTGEKASTYGEYLEFGTRNMKNRSFIRKGIKDNLQKIKKTFGKLASNRLR